MEQPALTRIPIYEALRYTRNRAADEAIVQALPLLEPEYRGLALRILLERNDGPSLATLISGFREYDEDLQVRLGREVNSLTAGLQACLSGSAPEAQWAALALIRAAGDCRAVYLVSAALVSTDNAVSRRAAEVLRDLTAQALDARDAERSNVHTASAPDPGLAPHAASSPDSGLVPDAGLVPDSASAPDPAGSRDIEHLSAALQQGLRSWSTHQRSEVLLAAAWLWDNLGGDVLGLVQATWRGAAHVLRGLLSGTPDVRLVDLAVRVLAEPGLQQHAAAFISRGRGPRFREALLRLAGLLEDERIRSGWAGVRSLASLDRDAAAALGGDRGRAQAAVQLVCASGMPVKRKTDTLREWLRAGDSFLREAVIAALLEQRALPGGSLLLHEALSGQAEEVAASIRAELQRRGWSEATAQAAAAADAVGDTRDSGALLRGFDLYWDEFENLRPRDRLVIGLAVRESTPAFARMLRLRLASPRPSEQVKALKIILELDLASDYETQAYRAAYDADAVVRSLAMNLLGRLGTPSARRILRGALLDRDFRVQANAIEAEETLGDQQEVRHLTPMLGSDNNRVRANAIKALLRLRVRSAAEELLKMLETPRSMDRLSALWVVEQMGMKPLLERLEVMAVNDPDDRVRDRARQVRGHLAEVRQAPMAPGRPAEGTARAEVAP